MKPIWESGVEGGLAALMDIALMLSIKEGWLPLTRNLITNMISRLITYPIYLVTVYLSLTYEHTKITMDGKSKALHMLNLFFRIKNPNNRYNTKTHKEHKGHSWDDVEQINLQCHFCPEWLQMLSRLQPNQKPVLRITNAQMALQ